MRLLDLIAVVCLVLITVVRSFTPSFVIGITSTDKREGIKIVPANIGELLTARGLAYWCMDS